MTTTTQPEFLITRELNAPREKVWAAWTQAERLAQWWGPKGCTLRVLTLDFKPGGHFHYAMEFQPGHEMFGRFVYQEIDAPERMTFLSSFADKDGHIAPAPFPQLRDSWPREIHNTLTLTKDGGKTRLMLRATPLSASDAEVATFTGMFESLTQGYGGTFEQLEIYLAGAASNAA